MQTEPYIPASERRRVYWDEVAGILGVSPDEAFHIYVECNWVTVGKDGFLDYLRRNETRHGKTAIETVRERYARCKQFVPHTPEVQADIDLGMEIMDEGDVKEYELKQVIEVGDEVLAQESKTFLSGGEYVTKGKWYRVLELKSTGNASFTAITTSNMPEERNWTGTYGISVVRRGGVVIYDRWEGTHLAYKTG